MSNAAALKDFFATWEVGGAALHGAVRRLFMPETVYENVGMSRTVGPDEAIALMDEFERRGGYAGIVVETLHQAEAGDVILNERVDQLIAADGREIMSFRLVGVFEFKDGKLVAWRDYAEPQSFPQA